MTELTQQPRQPIDKSFKIPYTDLKIEIKKLYPKQMADYKSRNRRMERRIQKILQGRDYPISSTYWTHRHHPLISTQARTITMMCGMSHFIFSKTPIDRLHRPNTKKTIFLHCKQYEWTIWTCQSRQNTSISKKQLVYIKEFKPSIFHLCTWCKH